MMYRHLKRGTYYEVLGEVFLNEFSFEGSMHTFVWQAEVIEAEFQYSGDGRYAGPVVFYKGLDNKHWLRPVFEFNDGRFEQLCQPG